MKRGTAILKHNVDGSEKMTLRCQCGGIIKGTSIKHAEANLKLHNKSKRHKEFMEYQKLNEVEKQD